MLNHHRESHYGRDTVAALQGVIALTALFDQLSKQDAKPEFHGLTRKESQERCDACTFNPARIFTSLKDSLLGNLPVIDYPIFAEDLTLKASSMNQHRFTGCRLCIGRTAEDLSFILEEVRSLANRLTISRRGRRED